MKLNNLIYFSLLILTTLSCDTTYYQQGKRIYTTNCESCHMVDGSGVSKLIPALINNGKPDSSLIKKYICTIYGGSMNTDSLLQMPSNKHLSQTEITNLVNYIFYDMNGLNLEVYLPQTKAYLSNCDNQ